MRIFLSILCLSSTFLFSQSFKDLTERPQYNPQFIDTEVILDGKLDEVFWQTAQIATDFTQTGAFQGEPSPYKTEVRSVMDADNLYFAFKSYFTEGKLNTSISKRDQLQDRDDRSWIEIDAFGDEGLIFAIGANPSGIQVDGRGGYGFDSSLDFIYEVASKIYADYYILEFKIPFSSLRYSLAESQTWRINFGRLFDIGDNVGREISWASKIEGIECHTCQLGFLNGLTPPKQERSYDFIPSFLYVNQDNYLDNTSTSDNEISLFTKVHLSSVDLIEFAFNPDFSQIESDDIQNDINSVNALYFKERRPFFTEGAEIFSTQGAERGYINLFYSRTINNPSSALKYTGKIGTTSYGIIAALDEDSPVLLPFEEFSSVVNMEKSDNLIIRTKTLDSNGGSFGTFFSNRSFVGEDSYMQNFGIDYHKHPGNNLHFTLHAVASIHKEPESFSTKFDENPYFFDKYTAAFDGEKIEGNALGLSLMQRTRTDYTGATLRLRSPGFRTSNGFESNNATKYLTLRKGKDIFYEDGPLILSGHSVAYIHKDNYSGQTLKQELKISNNFAFRNGNRLEIVLETENESYQDIQFDGLNEMQVQFVRPFSSNLVFVWEAKLDDIIIKFEDQPVESKYLGASNYFEYKISDLSQISFGVAYEKAEDHFEGVLMNVKLTNSFTNQFSMRTKIQFNEFSDSWFVEPLFVYQPNAFSAIYLGMNELYSSEDGIFSNIKHSQRQLFVKAQYLF